MVRWSLLSSEEAVRTRASMSEYLDSLSQSRSGQSLDRRQPDVTRTREMVRAARRFVVYMRYVISR